MKTLTLHANISAEGVIDLHVPSNLPAGPAEVVVVIQPLGQAPAEPGPFSIADLHGIWKDQLPDIDVEAELKEMNAEWEKNLEQPE